MTEAIIRLAGELGWRLTPIRALGWDDDPKVHYRTAEGEIVTEEVAFAMLANILDGRDVEC